MAIFDGLVGKYRFNGAHEPNVYTFKTRIDTITSEYINGVSFNYLVNYLQPNFTKYFRNVIVKFHRSGMYTVQWSITFTDHHDMMCIREIIQSTFYQFVQRLK